MSRASSSNSGSTGRNGAGTPRNGAAHQLPWAELSPFYEALEAHVGIALGKDKTYLAESRLAPLAQRSGHADVVALLRTLCACPPGPLHWEAFEAMATQETQFFRDRAAFDQLREVVLPEIINRRRSQRRLRIWSAGSSTGQEALSLSMLLADDFPELKPWSVEIRATDFCSQALARAQEGVYEQDEVSRGLDAEQLQRHFQPLGKGQFQVQPEIAARISYSRANLLSEDEPEGPFDLVLLRNVLIYFTRQRRRRIIESVCRQLAPRAGYLLLGSSETLLDMPTLTRRGLHRSLYYTNF